MSKTQNKPSQRGKVNAGNGANAVNASHTFNNNAGGPQFPGDDHQANAQQPSQAQAQNAQQLSNPATTNV